jgi:5-oxoprolinase (ATP-hydrolysing)
MSEAVKWQINNCLDWKEGEVLGTYILTKVANHPVAGGSHLPDITVITPVYSDNKVVFYVASRG